MSGTLYVVATPIGNLDDLSPRARQTLAEADLVAAEDTRHSGRLLSHIGAKPRLIALHEHNEAELVGRLIVELENGKSVALISDAGTPLVSDPGYRLVAAAHEHGIKVSPIPGASALTAALSAAGLPTDRFCFEGFLPAKQKARRDALAALGREERTIVFYESVHRIADSLADMAMTFGEDRGAFVGRELTKLHEQCLHGTLGELVRAINDGSLVGKGEFVVAVAGSTVEQESSLDTDRLLLALVDRLSAKDAAAIAAKATGGKKNALYKRVLELK
jgi:16S rRNA (cytidine1402-2'-O)-methyltransferase